MRSFSLFQRRLFSNAIIRQSKNITLTPEEIVVELGKHIIGQEEAKKAVAIALRNRWRRRFLHDALRAEVKPMNILMSGPTGSGKTEIARRLAILTDSPFLKVEATKFTEIGIYGANTTSIIKDLVSVAVNKEREKTKIMNAHVARNNAIDKIIQLLAHEKGNNNKGYVAETLRENILSGLYDNEMVNIDMQDMDANPFDTTMFNDFAEDPMAALNNIGKLFRTSLSNRNDFPFRNKNKTKLMTVKEALPILEAQECDKLIARDKSIEQRAIENVEQNGIVFLDEIDKLIDHEEGMRGNGAYNKGKGVQKELLGLIEGCAISTPYGIIHTDHILFIASGAFHRTKPSDLMPELQGRLSNRVTLNSLGEKEFYQILKNTKYNLIEQMKELMKIEKIDLSFTDDAVHAIAHLAAHINQQTDDIGARRLNTIISKVTEDISFYAPRMIGTKHEINEEYVKTKLNSVLQKNDLTKFIL